MNQLASVMEGQCVSCEVLTESLYKANHPPVGIQYKYLRRRRRGRRRKGRPFRRQEENENKEN
jgi:hypothetical protein